MPERRHRRLPFSSNAAVVAWPLGSDGDLTVLTGNTTTLTAGNTYDYNNITVQIGGVLRFSGGDGTTPTILGFKGIFDLSGTIQSKGNTSTAGGTFTNTAPDGFSMSYAITNEPGGDGGADGGFNAAGLGNTTGGGGGGGPGGTDGDFVGNGGAGGTGNGGGTSGAGGSTFGGSGSNGGAAVSSVTSNLRGGGGGGGARGINGGGLYIKGGASSTTSGTGTIDVSGSGGGSGGNGGSATNNKATAIHNAFGGGGGASGAGGCGGKVSARFKSSAPAWTYTISGGAPGVPGIGGTALALGTATGGEDGNYGATGDVGSTDIATY